MWRKPRVRSASLPPESGLWTRFASGDFLDCFVVDAKTSPRRAAEIITRFPGFAGFMLKIREVVTRPFGLLATGPDAPDKVGPFPVEHETDRELIAGFDDKHLDFRVSVYSQRGKVYLATWVHRHNLGGHLYLTAILPFHIWIARDALARVAREAHS